MAWSEFGRRPAENAAQGTDHGSAGPVFLLGQAVRGGLYGRMPSLEKTDFGSLIHTVDFRAVYTTVAERWFNCSVNLAATGDRFSPEMPLVKDVRLRFPAVLPQS